MAQSGDGFTLMDGVPESQRAAALDLYWEAFGPKLVRLMGPRARALRFFDHHIRLDLAFSALDAQGVLVGVAGYKTENGGFIGGDMSGLSAVYGRWGSLWRGLFLEMLERPPGGKVLQMDGICVRDDWRGRGVGAVLLDAICARAADMGCQAVRLDVIDTNPRARALYARKGFVAKSEEDIWPLHWLFGFRRSLRMERTV